MVGLYEVKEFAVVRTELLDVAAEIDRLQLGTPCRAYTLQYDGSVTSVVLL